ncbi:MAG: glycosidase [Candidatus Parcubacteria bacterium]|nr:MAG: glycosidase [Candidatus Parcubacteria bacterium]
MEGRIHFFYRAIGYDGVSRIGYASSYDGFTLAERLTNPIFAHPTRGVSAEVTVSGSSGGSWSGAEDPRATYIAEDDTIYLTYTACGGGLGVGLTAISRADLLAKQWRWRAPRVISPPHETHKNWVIFPQRIRGQYAILTSLSPRVLIHYRPSMTFAPGEWIESVYALRSLREGWEAYIRGAGPPPLLTPYGWLLFYHAVAHNAPGVYKVGALLLDSTNPTIILRRAPQPVLEPLEVYEWNGYKPGVVYATGAVILGSTLLLYYGAADTYVGVAYAPIASFLDGLISGSAPRFAYRRVRQRSAIQ